MSSALNSKENSNEQETNDQPSKYNDNIFKMSVECGYSFSRPKINFNMKDLEIDLENDLENDLEDEDFETNLDPGARLQPERSCNINCEDALEKTFDHSEDENESIESNPESDMSIEDLENYYKNL